MLPGFILVVSAAVNLQEEYKGITKRKCESIADSEEVQKEYEEISNGECEYSYH